jgi:hypothetical protein
MHRTPNARQALLHHASPYIASAREVDAADGRLEPEELDAEDDLRRR